MKPRASIVGDGRGDRQGAAMDLAAREADLLAAGAILADEERRHDGLPPRIAALLGRPAAPP